METFRQDFCAGRSGLTAAAGCLAAATVYYRKGKDRGRR